MVKLSIIGIGKLGICFALNLEKCGFEVLGIDISQEYIDLVNSKKLISPEPFVDEYLQNSKNFHAVTNLEDALENEIIFVIVATPSLQNGKYDHSQVESVIEKLEKLGRHEKNKHLIICSTVNPGYCDTISEKLEPLNYTVSYNPEFIAQGNVIKDQQNPDVVLIGEGSKEAGNKLQEIYEKMCTNNPVFKKMDRLSAEISKIAFNCFLTTKISFANSIGDLAKKVGADQEKILDAIGSDSRIGTKFLKYGYGYGGPCLPRDNRALVAYAQDNDIDLLISKATDETNKQHLNFQYQEFSENYKKQIVFDGIAYKKGTVILEESQPLLLAKKLAENGFNILIKDRQDVIEQLKQNYGNLFKLQVI